MRAALVAILTAGMLVIPSAVAGTVAPTPAVQSEVSESRVQVTADDADPESPDTDTDSQEDDAPATAPAMNVSMTSAEPVIEPGGEEVEFHVRLSPEAGASLTSGNLQIMLVTDPLERAEALNDTTIHPAAPRELLTLIETPALEADTVFETSFQIPAEDFPLTVASTPGVYRTAIFWRPDEFRVSDPVSPLRTGAPFVWNGAALDASLDLASIIPLVYPAGETPPTTPDAVDTELQEQRAMQRILPAAEMAGSLVAVDPRLVAYVRTLGASASADARDLTDLLTSGSLETFALEYGDADPLMTSILSPDAGLEPTGLSFLARFFTSLTEQVESDLAHPRVDPEAGSLTDGSVPPSLETALEWETGLSGFAWPAQGSVSTEAIDILTEAGYAQIVLGGADATGAAKGNLQGATVYHSEGALEEPARNLLLANTDYELASARATLAAVTALLGNDQDPEVPAQALLAVDRDLADLAESLEPLMAEFASLPWVRFIPTSELQLGTVQLVEEHNVEPAVEALRHITEGEADVVEYARVLDEPQLLIDYQRDRVAQALSVQGSVSNTEADVLAIDERVAVHLAGDAALMEGVHIVATEQTRLLGSTSNIPLQLRNTLPFDAKVVGTISTGNAALIVQNPRLEATTIPAESTINHIVTVRSRVSSGEVDLSVRLRDVHVGEDVDHARMHVTLSGTTETIALGTLSVIVIGLFVGGIWRSLARTKREGAMAVENRV